MSEVLENLKKARQLLVERGVGEAELFGVGYKVVDGITTKVGQFCALGAVTAAKFGLTGTEVTALDADDDRYPYHDLMRAEAKPLSDNWPELIALHEAMIPEDRVTGIRPTDLYRFNDRYPANEVLALFDRAIENVRNT